MVLNNCLSLNAPDDATTSAHAFSVIVPILSQE
jgi:hypothetical protein